MITNHSRCRWIARACVAVAALCLNHASECQAQDQSVRPGINETFRDPDLDVEQWVERFEVESREVFDEREKLLAALELSPGATVADVGAGTGLFTRLFARAVGTEGTVYAVDIAPKMLDYIRAVSEKQGTPQIKTILGSDESSKLPSDRVDLVFLCDTYHHFEFPQKMLASIHQALRPGGRLVVIDFIREPGVSSEWVLEHVRAGQSVVEQEIKDAGFEKVKEIDGILKENYFVIFEKPASE